MKLCLRNVLIAVGSYWLSTLAIAPLGIAFGSFDQRMAYGHSIPAAILMGVMLSLPRAVAAAAAGICTTLMVDGKRPVFWALVPAVLYAARAFRYQLSLSPTSWDHVWVNVARLFPAAVCIVAAFLVARLRHGRGNQSSAARR